MTRTKKSGINLARILLTLLHAKESTRDAGARFELEKAYYRVLELASPTVQRHALAAMGVCSSYTRTTPYTLGLDMDEVA